MYPIYMSHMYLPLKNFETVNSVPLISCEQLCENTLYCTIFASVRICLIYVLNSSGCEFALIEGVWHRCEFELKWWVECRTNFGIVTNFEECWRTSTDFENIEGGGIGLKWVFRIETWAIQTGTSERSQAMDLKSFSGMGWTWSSRNAKIMYTIRVPPNGEFWVGLKMGSELGTSRFFKICIFERCWKKDLAKINLFWNMDFLFLNKIN